MFGNIFESASKIVLMILAITACAGFIMGKLEAKDFMLLTVGVFSYYFAYKPAEKPVDSPVENPPTIVK